MIDSIATTIAVTFCNGPTINPELQQPPVPEVHKREWVGLDNDDLVWIYSNSDKVGQAISNTEARLKEKNGYA